MGMRLAILLGAAALGAAVMAAGASADFTSVHDPRGDTTCVHGHKVGGRKPCSDSLRRRTDIVRATAGHDGTRLRHTIRVVGRFQAALLGINTDSDPPCEWSVSVRRGAGRAEVRRCSAPRVTGHHARLDFHRHSVEIFFSKRSIGNPQSYGWHVFTLLGDSRATARDLLPDHLNRYITHQLGDSGAAAAGVIALGVQTAAAASAAVHKYGTKVTIARDRSNFFHGAVISGITKCERGRRVTLFKKRPGADRKLGTSRSEPHRRGHPGGGFGWGVRLPRGTLHRGDRHYVRVTRKESDRYVGRPDRSETLTY